MYRNRGVPRKALEAERKVVESQTDGVFAASTFLSLHLHSPPPLVSRILHFLPAVDATNSRDKPS